MIGTAQPGACINRIVLQRRTIKVEVDLLYLRRPVAVHLHLNVTTLVDAMSSTNSDEQVMKQIRARLMETGDWQR
jgi:hypothetical protein